MLDLSQIPGVKMGRCEDITCEFNDDPECQESTPLTYFRYIGTNKGPAWVCEGCLEIWSDELESYCDNRVDLDLPEAYPMIP